MKIVHIADSHLGLAAFNKLDADGMNLRERLMYDNFIGAIDTIIAQRPEVVIHAGDLFDQVRPKTRSLVMVLEALERLKSADIPLLIIAGNHSMTKTRYTTSPFSVLEYHGAEIHAAYQHRYRRVEVGEGVFHLIPAMLNVHDYRRAFDEIEPVTNSYNVMVTHGLATTLRDRRLKTVAEHEIDSTMLSGTFDYIALGHYHGQQQVGERAWYSGSAEYLDYGEIADTKGGLTVDLSHHSVEHFTLPYTPMIDGGFIDCRELTPREIQDTLLTMVEQPSFPDQSMVQLTLTQLDRLKGKDIDYRVLNDARERFLDIHIRIQSLEEERPSSPAGNLQEIDYLNEFSGFVKKKGFTTGEEEFVLKQGRACIDEILHQRRGEESAP